MVCMTPDPAWLTEPEQRLWRQWLRVNAALPATLHRALQADSGLSLPDFEVLVHLSERSARRLRVNDLARALGWEKSRLSHHLTRMERRGLLRRQECLDDGRGAFVVLTTEGRDAIEQAAPGHVQAVRRLVLDPLTRAETDALAQALEKILVRLECGSVPEPV